MKTAGASPKKEAALLYMIITHGKIQENGGAPYYILFPRETPIYMRFGGLSRGVLDSNAGGGGVKKEKIYT